MELRSHAKPSAPHAVAERLLNDPAQTSSPLPYTILTCAVLSAVPDQPSCAGTRKLAHTA